MNSRGLDVSLFRFPAVILFLCVTPLVCLANDLGTRTATQWFPYVEWSVSNPSWTGSPFDVKATVEFTHAGSGEKRRTEMFYAGESTWSFRFTGTKPGRWTFNTASDDRNLDGHTGQIDVSRNKQSDAHGFLTHRGDKWAWEGTGRPFVPQLVMWDYLVNSNNPRVYFRKPKLVEDKIQQTLIDRGFSGFHVPVIGGRWFDLDADGDRVRESMTEPDPRTFEALELLITKTHRAGGFVHIWPWGDHQRKQTPRSLRGRINGEVDRRLQRYIAARLGPLPGWSMGYGFDLDEWVDADEIHEWHNSMHKLMGWHHFLGGRPAGPNRGTDHSKEARWNTGLDYSSYEHHRPTYEVYRAALQATSNQPVMSEDRFRIRDSKYKDKDYNAERTRRGLYHSTLAGGVANIWGVSPDLSPGGLHNNRDQLKTYAIFFNKKRRFLADMQPANEQTGDTKTRVLLSPQANSLIAYREQAGTIQLDLSNLQGPLPAVAVDTKSAYQEIPLGEQTAKKQTIRLPKTSDWIIAVGRFRAAGRTASEK